VCVLSAQCSLEEKCHQKVMPGYDEYGI